MRATARQQFVSCGDGQFRDGFEERWVSIAAANNVVEEGAFESHALRAGKQEKTALRTVANHPASQVNKSSSLKSITEQPEMGFRSLA